MSQDILGSDGHPCTHEAQPSGNGQTIDHHGAATSKTQTSASEGSKTKLIVNYLPQTMTDAEYQGMFSSLGALVSCKIVRNKATGYSFGYGFVEYADEEGAAAAIGQINGMKILNKTLKVSYARPRADKNTNLYIIGLPKTYDDAKLEKLFSRFGEVIQSRVLIDRQSCLCTGAGFIILSSREECDKSISELNGTMPEGFITQIIIKYANTQTTQRQQQRLQAQASQEDYSEPVQSTAGPIRNNGKFTKAMGRPSPLQTQRQDTGLVTDTSLAARNELGIILFIRNMPISTTEEELFLLFADYGTVRKVNIMRDLEGQNKGFGFVTMLEDKEGLKAVFKLNNSMFNGRKIEVRFKLKAAQEDSGVAAAQTSYPPEVTPAAPVRVTPRPYIPSQDMRNLVQSRRPAIPYAGPESQHSYNPYPGVRAPGPRARVPARHLSSAAVRYAQRPAHPSHLAPQRYAVPHGVRPSYSPRPGYPAAAVPSGYSSAAHVQDYGHRTLGNFEEASGGYDESGHEVYDYDYF